MEMGDRIEVLNARLQVLHELLDMLRLQGQAQHSDFLEVIIILLICVGELVVGWRSMQGVLRCAAPRCAAVHCCCCTPCCAASPPAAAVLPCVHCSALPALPCLSAPLPADLVIMLIQVAATLYIGGGGGSDDIGDSSGIGGSEISYVPPGIAALLSILNLR